MNRTQDRSTILRFTSALAEHFFILDVANNDAAEDEDGYVMVFLSRSSADDMLKTLAEPGVPLFVVGMGEEKWNLFEKEVPHRIVPLASA